VGPLLASAQTIPMNNPSAHSAYAPGGPLIIRTSKLAQKITELPRPDVVADKRPGAGGNAAPTSRQSPQRRLSDLLDTCRPMAIMFTLYGKKLQFNPGKRFAADYAVAKSARS